MKKAIPLFLASVAILLSAASCSSPQGSSNQPVSPTATPGENSFSVSQEPVKHPTVPATSAVPTPIIPTNSATSAVSSAPNAGSAAAGNQAVPPPAAIQKTLINIQNFAFDLPEITIPVGSSVVWTNNDPVPHQIASASFNSPILKQGETFSQQFTAAGTYDYHCSIHPSMIGKIIVK
jgi:amicyanin